MKRNASGMRLALYALVAGLLPAALSQHSIAQTRPASRFSMTTMSGVYTTSQAARGEETYMNLCVGCHPVAAYSGAAFDTMWGGRSVSDLFNVIKDTMPKADAGSLSERESAQLVAYLFKVNHVPAGKTELVSDPKTLRTMRIETPSMRQGKTGHR